MIFSDAAKWMWNHLKSMSGVVLSYNRNGMITLIDGVVYDGKINVVVGDIAVEMINRDFVVRTSEMGTLFPPVEGDKIVVRDATFEVSPLGGKSCYEPEDNGDVLIRIHCRRIA